MLLVLPGTVDAFPDRNNPLGGRRLLRQILRSDHRDSDADLHVDWPIPDSDGCLAAVIPAYRPRRKLFYLGQQRHPGDSYFYRLGLVEEF